MVRKMVVLYGAGSRAREFEGFRRTDNLEAERLLKLAGPY